jgi:hypothetical protein
VSRRNSKEGIGGKMSREGILEDREIILTLE